MLACTIEEDIDALEAQSLNDLKEVWEPAFGAPPPRGMSRKLMVRALAHDLQVKALGGLKAKSKTKLRKALPPKDPPPTKSGSKLSPGTRLLREWNGVFHRVDVTEDGFSWNGRPWSSLSAIAREITGTRWNGPLFFGLRQRSESRS